jgi:hypothetical protein
VTATMQDANGAVKFYSYPFSQTVITYLLMPMVAVISLVLGTFLLKADSTIVGVLLILFGACLFFLSACGSLMCSRIVVGDKGIAAYNFGRTLKFIRWQDVTKIKKVRRWNAGSRSYEDVFYAFDGDYPPLQERMVNLRGPVTFSDKIRGVRDLLDKINEYARRHHFLLITLAQETMRELAAPKEAGSLGQTAVKSDETEVTEF